MTKEKGEEMQEIRLNEFDKKEAVEGGSRFKYLARNQMAQKPVVQLFFRYSKEKRSFAQQR